MHGSTLPSWLAAARLACCCSSCRQQPLRYTGTAITKDTVITSRDHLAAATAAAAAAAAAAVGAVVAGMAVPVMAGGEVEDKDDEEEEEGEMDLMTAIMAWETAMAMQTATLATTMRLQKLSATQSLCLTRSKAYTSFGTAMNAMVPAEGAAASPAAAAPPPPRARAVAVAAAVAAAVEVVVMARVQCAPAATKGKAAPNAAKEHAAVAAPHRSVGTVATKVLAQLLIVVPGVVVVYYKWYRCRSI